MSVAAIAWKDPWYSIEDAPDIQEAMCAQLAKELSRGHVLNGRRVCAIGRRIDNDDVLFVLDGGPEVAVVHLTWRRSREESPKWPATSCFPDIGGFVRDCLVPDAADYGAADR